MRIEFDSTKNASNIEKHGISLERANDFDWRSVLVQTTRPETDHTRQRVLGLIDGRLYSAIVTPRGYALRVISMRPANRKEQREHAKTI